uniref:2-oxo-4-hydroxy-4-carboxy-5-ureidoimidazoline decarboxylase n=1 Tax=Branchiostoma floridae TaxID=7739 RepID=C3Y217_BRAFL|eukprot:XP_002609897.1 hypothetical protein BRAFLDRAFT_90720 [Branchiostoma floridae]
MQPSYSSGGLYGGETVPVGTVKKAYFAVFPTWRELSSLAREGRLSLESTGEQRAAGLLDLTTEEQTTRLNSQYRRKFGVPFVLCARLNKKDAVLKGLKTRINSSKEEEIKTGIEEAKKICWLRLVDVLQREQVDHV